MRSTVKRLRRYVDVPLDGVTYRAHRERRSAAGGRPGCLAGKCCFPRRSPPVRSVGRVFAWLHLLREVPEMNALAFWNTRPYSRDSRPAGAESSDNSVSSLNALESLVRRPIMTPRVLPSSARTKCADAGLRIRALLTITSGPDFGGTGPAAKVSCDDYFLSYRTLSSSPTRICAVPRSRLAERR